jgi:uncharacterized oxidoreductase
VRTVSATALGDLVCAIVEGTGTPAPIARRVAEVLVNSNLAGHDSHGVIRLREYLDQIDQQAIAVRAEPAVIRETPATAVMDGRRGWGHWAVDRAMALAIDKCRATGLGAVALFRTNHAGRMGEYVEAAARAGAIGLVVAGAGGRDVGCSAPLGGRGRYLGPNPIAVGVPAGDGPPLVLDFATTVVARGKVTVAQSLGQPLAEGWIVDAQGRASVRPEDFFAGGTLLHFGGHKGYGLSVLTCVLGGLSGGFQPEHARMGGLLIQAIDVNAFQPREQYEARVRQFLDGIKAAPRAPGVDEILVPGEPEWRSRARRLAEGIALPDAVWQDISNAAERRGIALPPSLDHAAA